LKRPLPPPLPVGITYAPLAFDEGKLRNVIVSVRDITHFRTQMRSRLLSSLSSAMNYVRLLR
jgi:hypothetical protein